MSGKSQRLWHKGGGVDEIIHRFTVGDDPSWDLHLVAWDCLGSAAHAQTLNRGGVLSDADQASLREALSHIAVRHARGEFEIPAELEDCHTAIEAALVEACGDAGARIHAGRSRNDQVATAMRLYMRAENFRWAQGLVEFIEALGGRAVKDGAIPMPGYTHLQPAMPSSIDQWLGSIAAAAEEQLRASLDLDTRLDCCPLGTGAGYGVPLPLDRAFTAELLGFSRVQENPIDVQNSRGRMEKYFVRVGADIAAMLEKMAADLVLFCSAEFHFFSLPVEMTTGSSIMPNKRNPDVLELMRAHAGRVRSRQVELENVTAKLTGGYHRDLQLTKEPAIRTALEVADLLAIAARVIGGLKVNVDRLDSAMRPELYATHAALALVQEGLPFRQAYQQIAEEIAAGAFDESRAEPYRKAAAAAAPGEWIPTAKKPFAQVADRQERWRESLAGLLSDTTWLT